jgi:SAM-dependent methyltransferase
VSLPQPSTWDDEQSGAPLATRAIGRVLETLDWNEFRRLPYRARRFLESGRRRVGAMIVDSGRLLMGTLDRSIPPTHLQFVGDSDFKATGFEFLRYFIEYGELRPDEDVLDVGSGIGRMALPLVPYLRRGSYRGFDIVPAGIAWCRENISSQHPNFEFERADIYNEFYNPRGRQRACNFRFPYADRSFDFAFLTSVFTHLSLDDTRHYLSEISRCLRPTGRVLSTWFLLDDEVRAQIRRNPNALQLVYPWDGVRVMIANPNLPEGAVGYDEALVRALHAEVGLELDQNVRRGSWTGRPEYVSYQDLLVARKAE